MLIIGSSNESDSSVLIYPFVAMSGSKAYVQLVGSDNRYEYYPSFSGNTVSWYGSYRAVFQFNTKNVTYSYIAIG